MVRAFDIAWSIIKYDSNEAIDRANAYHQTRIDAMRSMPDPRSRNLEDRHRGAPSNPFKRDPEELREALQQAAMQQAAMQRGNMRGPPLQQEPRSTMPPAGTMPLSAGKPREQRRGERSPSEPRRGYRSNEPMPLTDTSASKPRDPMGLGRY